nr:alpha/beta hydrolase domain-containing protein [Acidobacteriota bacterium]
RIYMVSSGPHIVGQFPPAPNPSASFLGQASMNPLVYAPVIRALFDALDAWVVDDREPPPSRYPRLADKTLTPPPETGWPEGTGARLPQSPLTALRLDFGPNWSLGIVSNEPPLIGDPFVQLVPAVDANGNDRAGIRLPEIEVPLATQTGWNYRHPNIGAADRLSSEIGSYFPFARTAAEREQNNDARLSIAERYRDKSDYLGRVTEAALHLVEERYLLATDLPEVIQRAENHYDWAVAKTTTRR